MDNGGDCYGVWGAMVSVVDCLVSASIGCGLFVDGVVWPGVAVAGGGSFRSYRSESEGGLELVVVDLVPAIFKLPPLLLVESFS
jgi:hypothetical protein